MAEYRTITVAVSLSDSKVCTDVRLSENTITVKPELSAPVKVSDLPAYYGDTTVTPSEQTQTLNTAHTAVLEDITVEPIPGRYKDTSAADFDSGDLLSGKTGYNANGAVVGTMSDNGSVGGVIGTKDGSITIPAGYTTGGTVSLTNVGDLLPENLLAGRSVLGVDGGIPVNGATGGSIGTKNGSVTIPEGYTTGGSVVLNGVDDLLPENVLAEKTILSIKGGIPNNGTTGGVISAKNGSVRIPEGYTTGGTVSLSGVEDLNPENLLIGKTVLGVSGKIPNNGATGGVISTKDGSVTIPEGYTTGGTVSLTDTADLEPQNFLKGKTVLGIEGALAPPVATDVSDTTATAEDVLTGKVFFDSSGNRQVGTASGATAVAVTDAEDPAGGTVRSITAIDLTGDTVTPATLLKGVIAHDAHGNRIVGEYEP